MSGKRNGKKTADERLYKSNKVLIIVSISLIIVLVGLFIIFGRGNEEETVWKYQSFDYFDTITEVMVYDKVPAGDEEALKVFIDEKLDYYHKLFDIYHTYEGLNNAKSINDNAGLDPVPVPEELSGLIDEAKLLHIETDGKFNIALGSVLKIWHAYREEGTKVPAVGELVKAAAYTDISKIQVKGNVVFINMEGVSIDLGGIGKGYAAELLSQDLEEYGIKNALISLGGNIVAVGNRNGKDYTVGIEDPENEGTSKVILKIGNLSAVTSGDYQRFYEVDGKRYCHIIDPGSLYPQEYYRSVTVIAGSSLLADAMATALFNMDPMTAYEYVNSDDRIEAMWIMRDGSVNYSNGFRKYIK